MRRVSLSISNFELRAKRCWFRHLKLFHERVNYAAHMIGGHKVAQHHGKLCPLISPVAFDRPIRSDAYAQQCNLLIHLCLKRNGPTTGGGTFVIATALANEA
jgi:hypothetical protein